MNKYNKFHGNYLEDEWIANNLQLPHKGVFIDVGASDAIKRSNERHPSKRINTASDVAKTAEFLLQNNNITGQIIHVDGGMSTLKV